jgi:hypothetical protein
MAYVSVKIRTNLVMNMTDDSYVIHNRRLKETTILNRLFTIYYKLPFKLVNVNFSVVPDFKVHIPKNMPARIPEDMNEKIEDFCKEFENNYDTNIVKRNVRSFLVGHALLNSRNEVLHEDLELLKRLRPFFLTFNNNKEEERFFVETLATRKYNLFQIYDILKGVVKRRVLENYIEYYNCNVSFITWEGRKIVSKDNNNESGMTNIW